MSEFNEPAYPQFHTDPWDRLEISGGLTIRQQAVLMMAQSLIANPACDLPIEDLVRCAIEYADTVLKRERETRDE